MSKMEEIDWTFAGANTRDFTHIYHDYPARMIPQIPRTLLKYLDIRHGVLFDPYCGSGTTLVEGLLGGLDSVGVDINPLAKLISEAKTDYFIDPSELRKSINDFIIWTMSPSGTPIIPRIYNIEFWFKPTAIKELGLIMGYIYRIDNIHVRNFFLVAASETIRESSNTRKDEFKLYRYPAEKLKKHNPHPFDIMKLKLERNYRGYLDFYNQMRSSNRSGLSRVYIFDTVKPIPSQIIPDEEASIVITSPPYGDSHTTVAYGQYSRLSLEWLGLGNGNVDKLSMGGRRINKIINFGCSQLDSAISNIAAVDEKRALEVVSFYLDLKASIQNVSKKVKTGGYSCYVVADRRVKKTTLPTHEAIKCFFEDSGLSWVNTFIRNIPNKRMPAKNSPTNIVGYKEETMSKEYIVIMKK